MKKLAREARRLLVLLRVGADRVLDNPHSPDFGNLYQSAKDSVKAFLGEK